MKSIALRFRRAWLGVAWSKGPHALRRTPRPCVSGPTGGRAGGRGVDAPRSRAQPPLPLRPRQAPSPHGPAGGRSSPPPALALRKEGPGAGLCGTSGGKPARPRFPGRVAGGAAGLPRGPASWCLGSSRDAGERGGRESAARWSVSRGRVFAAGPQGERRPVRRRGGTAAPLVCPLRGAGPAPGHGPTHPGAHASRGSFCLVGA